MSADGDLVAGRYRLTSLLGHGGMGVVWRAEDELLGRTVAVKLLSLPADLSDPKAAEVKRLAMREGRLAAKLQHPHAIMVYDVAEDDGQPCLVMEYLPSRSLAEVLAESGPLSWQEAARIGSQVAAALASAHAAGVVHRDVKPGNVLLGSDGAAGTVKITDFGISRAVEDATVTATGIFAGTPAYLAPEVARGGRATFSSDVFSLGSTLYTAVEGTPPFGVADNAIALLHRIANEPITPPRRAGPLTDVLQRLLQPDPERRPTMAQTRAALTAMASGNPEASTAILAGPAGTAILTDGGPGPGPDPGNGAVGAAASGPGPTAPLTPLIPPAEQPVPATVGMPYRAWPAAPPPRARPAPRRGGSRRWWVPVVAAILVLGAGAGLLALILKTRDPNQGAAAPTATQTSAATASAAPSSAPAPAQTSRPAATTPAATTAAPSPAQPPPAGTPQDTQAAQRRAITDYYALMPGNTEEGWTRLTARYQQGTAGGIGGYQRFWSQMRAVQASGAASRGDGVVEATVRYEFKDGRVITERHRYTLVERDGRWLIDSHTVLSSQ